MLALRYRESVFGQCMVLLVTLCLTLLTLWTARPVMAQELPAWMQVRRSQFLASETNTSAVPLPSRAYSRPTRRAAYLLAVGGGLVTAGALHAGLLGQRGVCHDSDDRVGTAIPAGSVLATAGLALTVPAAIMLARVPRAERKLKEIDGIGILGAYLGTGLAASALLMLIAAPQLVACSQS